MAETTLHKTIRGHESSVRSVAFSPDNKLIASASDDQTVLLWNIPNNNLNAVLRGHEREVLSVAFSPDGQSIATGSWDCTVRTWSVATKQQVKILNGHSDNVDSVAWSPNGALIASGSRDKTVILWHATSGSVKKKLKGHSNWVYSVSFSQNGNKLASAGSYDKTVIIWDVYSGAALIKLAHHNVVWSVCFARGDQLVVTGCGDNIVRIFNVNNGHEEKRFEGHTGEVNWVACSFDGSIIASGSDDNSVRLWDVASTKQLQQLDGHTKAVLSVAFSRDGKFIASASADNAVCLWNAPSSLQPKPVSSIFCAALYDFAGTEKGMLSFQQNSILLTDDRNENGWARARLLPAGASGWIPLNYVEIISEAEAQRRLQQQKQELKKQKKQEEEAKKTKATLDPSQVAVFRNQKKGRVLTQFTKEDKLESSTSSSNSFIIQRHELNVRDIVLGSGHFGKVMLADYKGMPVAVKQSKASDADKYKEFVNEALMMTQVPHHEFVVNCVGLCMRPNEAYVVLELCEGSLLDRLRDTSQPPLEPKQRLEILHKMAQGMDHLCQHHILHVDFACRNVLYQLAGDQIVPKISDFSGVRKITSEKKYCSVRVKNITFAWTAPEVLFSLYCDHLSDVFSFGVTIWEIYTNGAEPHADKQSLMIPGFVNTASNYPLLPQPPQCPDDAYDLINRCMALDPKHRPTFAQIVAQLSQMLANI